jgi:16S rRNA (adenine1518-N6/adenine1519-N6)-dimethyltransferase
VTTARPRKRFGQHFLEPAWVDKLIAAIAPSATDTFLEIGPGAGALTLALAPRVGRLVAVEIDRDLAPALAARVPAHVTIVNADFLRADVAALVSAHVSLRVTGNLPYNVSTPILSRLLELSEEGRRFRDATLMLQLEVARRLTARPGSRDWGVLGACQQLRAGIDLLLTLPPGAFRPPPKVHSAVVRVRYRDPVVPVARVDTFESLVRAIFMQRRKMLSNALTPFAGSRGLGSREVIEAAGVDGRRRPETLTLAELARLSDVFASA